jgi:hypothetical protein
VNLRQQRNRQRRQRGRIDQERDGLPFVGGQTRPIRQFRRNHSERAFPIDLRLNGAHLWRGTDDLDNPGDLLFRQRVGKIQKDHGATFPMPANLICFGAVALLMITLPSLL